MASPTRREVLACSSRTFHLHYKRVVLADRSLRDVLTELIGRSLQEVLTELIDRSLRDELAELC